MAPNRKHSPLTLETAPSFNLQVQAKFAPLTSEVSQQEEQKEEPQQKKLFGVVTTIHASHTNEPSDANNSYWDWASDEIVDEPESEKTQIIEDILKEEQARQVLSADHICANLQKSNDAKTDIIYASQVDEDYWYDGNDHATDDDVPVATQPQQQSYWDWPTRTSQEEKQKAIDDIMEEERCRKVMSTLRLVDSIVRQSASDTSNKKIQSEKPSQASDSYWGWSHESSAPEGYWEWPATAQDEKKLFIQQIMTEEQVRKQFSIQHLESKLVAQQYSVNKVVTPTVTATTAPSSSYWEW